MPPAGSSKVPGVEPRMSRREYQKLYQRNRRGPKKQPSIPGILPGMTRAEKQKVYSHRSAHQREAVEQRKAEICRIHPRLDHEVVLNLLAGCMRRAKSASSSHSSAPLSSHHMELYTEFESREDVVRHFESTFESWMKLDNYGRHNPKGPRTWTIGHHIPRREFDMSNLADARRCWSKQNLFAQDGQENNEMWAHLPENVMQLRDVWPQSWNGIPPSVPN